MALNRSHLLSARNLWVGVNGSEVGSMVEKALGHGEHVSWTSHMGTTEEECSMVFPLPGKLETQGLYRMSSGIEHSEGAVAAPSGSRTIDDLVE